MDATAFMRSLSETISAWMDATVAMSLERSVVHVALALDDPIPQAFCTIVDGQRVMGAERIENALTIAQGI